MRNITSASIIFFFLLLALPLHADDTSIFTGTSVDVTPNVLILLDNSNSMNEMGEDAVMVDSSYDKTKDYKSELDNPSNGYDDTRVYYWDSSRRRYRLFPSGATPGVTVSALGCSTARTGLSDADGMWTGRIYATGAYNCCSGGGCTTYQLYTGHRLNYERWYDEEHYVITASKTKKEIAREVVTELLTNVEQGTVNFGLMTFNTTQFSNSSTYDAQGGTLISPIGTANADIITAMNSQVFCSSCFMGNTPLAEALCEAGLYFAGKKSWSQSTSTSAGPVYTSPIQWRCQKNYIVIVTDGEPTRDLGVNSRSENIFTNRKTISPYAALSGYFDKAIGDYDEDGADTITSTYWDTSHLLDDVAKFLYEEDLINSGTDHAEESFEDTSWPTQNVRTFAIGFSRNSDLSFLNRVVDTAHGRGGTASNPDAAYLATNSQELRNAFKEILSTIIASNATFIAPVVPVSKLNKVYSGNSVYLSLFKPDSTDVFWRGNIKKFGLGPNGNILDINGQPATDQSGQILSSTYSCWPMGLSVADASTPDSGGAGAAILTDTTRSFYTYNHNDATASTSLTATSNAFSSANTAAMTALGVTTPADLAAFLTATGVYAPGGSDARPWVLGDILHSKPATMIHGDDIIIFAGSNDGFLHAFVDNDGGTPDVLADDTITEAWNFVPWDILPNLHALKEAGSHQAFVDGSPTIYDDLGYRYVAFGLRRGGDTYYSLRVGSLDTNGNYAGGYGSPVFNRRIGPNILTGHGGETLGQSWSKPLLCTIRNTSTSTNKVLLLTGGYDTAEDADTPAVNTKGRAIFAVDATTCALETNLNFNHGLSGSTDMTSCIVELTAFDYNNDGIEDTIYAGDLGGNLFGFNDRNGDGTWSKVKVFQARSAAAGTAGMLLKFFYEPDVSQETFGDYLYIGTGDREHPDLTSTVNRIYGIKNTWSSTWTTLTEASLEDVTDYNYTATVLSNLQSPGGHGWFIKLNVNSGEKVVSSPLIYNGIVFFTTYTPSAVAASAYTDECYSGGNLGVGRLYALDCKTGKAAMNLDESNDTTTTDASGNTVTTEVKARSDRSTTLGVGLPSSPTLVVTKDGGAMLIIGTGGPGGTTGAPAIAIPSASKANMYYWKQK